MQDEKDIGILAVSALIGGVATVVQELVVAGSVDAERLHARLNEFLAQDAIQTVPASERELITKVIGNLQQAVAYGLKERNGK